MRRIVSSNWLPLPCNLCFVLNSVQGHYLATIRLEVNTNAVVIGCQFNEITEVAHDHADLPMYVSYSDLSQLGIQAIPQPVPQQVDRQYCEQHRQPWKQRDPPGSRQEATAVGDHQSPGRAGRGDPNPQKT